MPMNKVIDTAIDNVIRIIKEGVIADLITLRKDFVDQSIPLDQKIRLIDLMITKYDPRRKEKSVTDNPESK